MYLIKKIFNNLEKKDPIGKKQLLQPSIICGVPAKLQIYHYIGFLRVEKDILSLV